MTGSGGGRSDGRDKPGGAPGPDATHLVFRNEKNEHSDDATVILDPRYRPVEADVSPHNAGGTIIGDVRDAQKGVRVPGQQGGQHGAWCASQCAKHALSRVGWRSYRISAVSIKECR